MILSLIGSATGTENTFPLPLTTGVNFQIDDVLSLIALMVTALYVVFTGVFYYHWNNYATDGKVKNITLVLYFITTIPLLLIIGIITLMVI